MGSKLHQINRLFTTLQKNKCNIVTTGLKYSDIRAVSDNISVKASIFCNPNQIKGSMERLLQCHDRNSIRNTMLHHEEILRQQVHELHHLYRVQKMLMAELGNKEINISSFPNETAAAVAETKTRIWSSASTSNTSHSSHVSILHQSAACSARAGPSSRELSICSEDPSSVQMKSFGARTVKNQAAAPLSWTDDGSQTELTLSIGCSSNEKKQTPLLHLDTDTNDTRPQLSSRSVMVEKEEECGDSSTGLDSEDLKTPSWLLLALNLNKT
ncbi:unnamed protein product [Musa acuminata subsp. malaccensis]|uniref:(wild Malaysian banana) hypothetical protein n=1 Tax=Musa acuminata subsp. malaccensis TaxID=214687 RepID=A0A804IK63_MUSAM|nr:PREDICTED: uncharacterized protein LOC103980274 [Musa acuminata subsp. malaccensis]CAG1840966.1 unnamed protein product [Musa acuminata subsp. malaccensis]